MSLSTLPSLKTLLGVTTNAKNTLLTQLLDAADAAIKRYVKRDLERTTYTEYLDGNGQQDLLIRQRPVISVTTLHEDSGGYYGDGPTPFATDKLLTAGSDFVLVRDGAGGRGDSGLLRRLRPAGGAWWWSSVGSPGVSTLFGGPRGPVWPVGNGNVKVVYVAGFDPIPDDLMHAANQLAAWIKRIGPQGGIPLGSESLGRYSYSMAQAAYSGLTSAPELGSTRQLLAAYREVIL